MPFGRGRSERQLEGEPRGDVRSEQALDRFSLSVKQESLAHSIEPRSSVAPGERLLPQAARIFQATEAQCVQLGERLQSLRELIAPLLERQAQLLFRLLIASDGGIGEDQGQVISSLREIPLAQEESRA